MSDETKTIPAPMLASASRKAKSKADVRFVAIGPTPEVEEIIRQTPNQNGVQTTQIQDVSFDELAASYQPLVDQLTGIVDGAAAKVIESRASAIYGEVDAAKLGEKVRMSPEARKAIKLAGSRIAARKIKNPEHVDTLLVVAAMGDWMRGLIVVMAELNKASKNGEITNRG